MKTYTYNEIVKMYGEKVADQAMASNAEPTNRLMYPAYENPNHLEKSEYAGEPVVADNGDQIQAYYYLATEDEENPDSFDWLGNVEFQIN